MKLGLIDEEESERLMQRYWRQAAEYTFLPLFDGEAAIPAFILKNDGDLIKDEDGGVTWAVREIGLGLHSFIAS